MLEVQVHPQSFVVYVDCSEFPTLPHKRSSAIINKMNDNESLQIFVNRFIHKSDWHLISSDNFTPE